MSGGYCGHAEDPLSVDTPRASVARRGSHSSSNTQHAKPAAAIAPLGFAEPIRRASPRSLRSGWEHGSPVSGGQGSTYGLSGDCDRRTTGLGLASGRRWARFFPACSFACAAKPKGLPAFGPTCSQNRSPQPVTQLCQHPQSGKAPTPDAKGA
jgi:hypothetical protein